MNRQGWLWTAPFLCFLGGYLGVSYRIQQRAGTETPSIVGLSIQKGLFLLSSLHLSGTVVGEREDRELAPGTIIDQIPAPGHMLRPLQAVGIIVTKEPSYPIAPDLVGQDSEQAIKGAEREGFRVRSYPVPLSGVIGTVCAQSPCAGDQVPERVITVYVVGGMTPIRIVPDFRGLPLHEVQGICTEYGIVVQVHHKSPVGEDHCCNCRVEEHVPVEGELIDITKPLMLQVMVENDT